MSEFKANDRDQFDQTAPKPADKPISEFDEVNDRDDDSPRPIVKQASGAFEANERDDDEPVPVSINKNGAEYQGVFKNNKIAPEMIHKVEQPAIASAVADELMKQYKG